MRGCRWFGAACPGVRQTFACCTRAAAYFRLVTLGVCALQTTFAQPAAAQPRSTERVAPLGEVASRSNLEQARELQARGVAAFGAGDYTEAIEAFVEADRWVPSAALSFNVARAYDRLGDTGQSLFWYSDYLRRAPDAADADQIRALIAERESKLAAQGTQLLVVRTNPSGAALALDGKHVCKSPCATITTPGVHALVFSHEARPLLSVRVQVGLPRLTEAHFDLEPALLNEPVPVAPNSVTSTSQASTPTAPIGSLPPTPRSPHVQDPINGWGWATLVAGGVGLGLAGGLELVRRDAESDAREARIQLDKQAALDRMDRATLGARIAGAVGGALLLTSGVLWWRAAQDESSGLTATAATSSFTPILTPWQAGLEFSLVGDVW